MVLSFQLTKHLTRQSRRMHTGTGHEPDEGRGKNNDKKKLNQIQLIMNFAKEVFKSLVLKLPRWQLCAWWDTVWIEPASIFKSGGERRLASSATAGEALPWKPSGFGPECAHVPLCTVLTVLFSRLVQGREFSFFFFFFLFKKISNSTSFEFFFCLFTVEFSVFIFLF